MKCLRIPATLRALPLGLLALLPLFSTFADAQDRGEARGEGERVQEL